MSAFMIRFLFLLRNTAFSYVEPFTSLNLLPPYHNHPRGHTCSFLVVVLTLCYPYSLHYFCRIILPFNHLRHRALYM